MTNPFRVLKQMWKYHSTYDIEKALRRRFEDGKTIGRREAEAEKKPCCDFHTSEPLISLAIGIFGCPVCRQISQPLPVVRPTIKLSPQMAQERHTDKVRLPAQVYSQSRNNGAGTYTAVVAALPKNRRGKQ